RGLRGAAGRAGRAGSRLHGDRPARRAGLGPRRRRGSPAASRRPAAARDGAPAAHADVRARGGRVMAHRAGIVAIVGRPNVGKSTLLNALVGAKVAIVTPKPQTTRTRVVGIRTLPGAQAVFVDTPGIHDARSTLNRRMVETARRVLEEADAALLVLDASAGVVAGDRTLAAQLAPPGLPTFVGLNKVAGGPPSRLLPWRAERGPPLPAREIVRASAPRGDNVPLLLDLVTGVLPEGPPLHAEDDFTTE